MNWKEQPHLFHGFEVETERKQRLPVVGATLDKRSLILQASIARLHYDIDRCTLIARPKSDMTEKEKVKYTEVHNSGILDIMNHKNMLYLLSIGVYPFPDTEDVIFKPKQVTA